MSRKLSLVIPDSDWEECKVELRDVSVTVKSSGAKILNNINASFEPGTLTAIIGPSGAGKTMILRTMTGYLPDGVTLDGTITVNAHRRSTQTWPKMYGYVRQEEDFYEQLTLMETLEFAAHMRMKRRGFTYQETNKLRMDRVKGLIEHFGLEGSKDLRMSQLSGGERRRASIALEMITEPPILFLDEPTTGLDSTSAETLLQYVRDMSRIQRRTVIITLHHTNYSLMKIFDKFLLLSSGSLIFNGSIYSIK